MDVRFLAAGEYNENYLVRNGDGLAYVFRINHGSQLGLDRQIEYEFNVLRAVAPSGVTPAPLFVDPEPSGLPGGVLLMITFPEPLWIIGAIWTRPQQFSPGYTLLLRLTVWWSRKTGGRHCRRKPGAYSTTPDHPMTDVRDRLLHYHQTVLDLFEQTRICSNPNPW